jgi:hypothetical protein
MRHDDAFGRGRMSDYSVYGVGALLAAPRGFRRLNDVVFAGAPWIPAIQ